MSAFYDDLADTAATLLADLGQAVTLTRRTAGAYDPATGSAGLTDTTSNALGLVFEYNTFIRSGVRNEPSSLIQAGDKQLLLSPVDVTGAALARPQDGDLATFGGVTYTITAAAPCAPAGTVVYFECNIRGAP